MNDYLSVGLVTILITVGIIVLVRLRSGQGILSRLFSVIMPSIGAIGYIAFVLGKQGVTVFTLTLAAFVGVICIVTMVFIIQRNVINKIRQQTDTILSVVNSLSVTSQEAAASAEEQAAAVAQVTSSIEEIHRMSQSTTATAQDVVKVAAQAVSQGHDGLESVREVLRIMDRFAQATDFVQVVGEVAEQSNLLAVNAGIEAAKAGEYGRGFAVVASEVRNLAEQSRDAAKQIREAINQTRVGQDALKTTDSVISNLGAVLQDTSDKARQISGAAVQQSAGIKQISDAMSNLTQGGHDTAMASRQIKKAAVDLREVGGQLALLIQGNTSL